MGPISSRYIHFFEGFTGKYVVDYICKTCKRLKWAIAGRSEFSLQQILADIANSSGKDITLPEIIIADVFKPETLDALTKRVKVLINCVGPYRHYGEAVVKASIENGADYVDISGKFSLPLSAMPFYVKKFIFLQNKNIQEKLNSLNVFN